MASTAKCATAYINQHPLPRQLPHPVGLAIPSRLLLAQQRADGGALASALHTKKWGYGKKGECEHMASKVREPGMHAWRAHRLAHVVEPTCSA